MAKLDILKYYNIQEDLIHASADGQKFESRLETFRTRYSSKYFGTNKGVSAMTLVANHAALNSRVIGSNEHESHYIFDLLQSNTSDIKLDVLSTDTHGTKHVNFTLLDLFGYTFDPRYASFGSEIDLWNECARFMANAIIYFNSAILSKLLHYFEQNGDEANLDRTKRVSPVAWINVNLNGTYSFSFEQNMADLDEITRFIVAA